MSLIETKIEVDVDRAAQHIFSKVMLLEIIIRILSGDEKQDLGSSGWCR
jgi:hypothetical protein